MKKPNVLAIIDFKGFKMKELFALIFGVIIFGILVTAIIELNDEVTRLKKREKILADAVEMLQRNEKVLHSDLVELYKINLK